VVLIAGFLTAEGFQFIFTQIVAGVVAVLAIADARYWSKFFKSVLFIFLAYSVSLLGLEIIEEGDFMQLDWSMHGWLVLNGVLTLMAFPLIPLMERAFGFTSSISLMELADLNRPLLRELAMKAPGTFQHSFQVGNLAEAAANEIGVNPLLVRTGALYHDIGKMLNPEFFVENQSGSSPHENLTHLESATIIIAHVTEGVRLAKKYRLPKVITRFITTHHGTTKVEYFYKTYLQENPGKEVDPADFTYPGPKPQTKSETVVMLADSIEATARTLKNPTGKDIDDLVDKIIAGKSEKGQLSESKFTFSDLEKCRHVFKKMLRSIHHVRLEYPE
jgi:cyclic-di-AMP phosphodiesterase PgpH